MAERIWTRPEIIDELVTIIVETRGVDEEEVVETTTLFEDLGLESIDFLEISFRIEESFGFRLPVDGMGEIFNKIAVATEKSAAIDAINELAESFHMEPVDFTVFPEFAPPSTKGKGMPGSYARPTLNLMTFKTFVDFVVAKLKERGEFSEVAS